MVKFYSWPSYGIRPHSTRVVYSLGFRRLGSALAVMAAPAGSDLAQETYTDSNAALETTLYLS